MTPWSSSDGPPPEYRYPLANAVIEHLLDLGYVLCAGPFEGYHRGPRVTISVSKPHPKHKDLPNGLAIGYIDVGPGATEIEVLDKNKVRLEIDAAQPTAFSDLVSFLDRK